MMRPAVPQADFAPLVSSAPLVVRHGSRGRGLFALRAIPAGALIERCPVIEIPAAELTPGVIAHYVFCWERDGRTDYALPTGHGLLFNHGTPANVTFVTDPQAGCVEFSTSRAVAPDEELLIDYAYDSEHLAVLGHPTWFRSGVARP